MSRAAPDRVISEGRERGSTDFDVAVVGAGFSGIGTAIKLDEAGIEDWVLLEEGDGVGGAWHWNTYPGLAVDIPSFSYQFSFEQRTDWSRVYARGEELKAYAEHCVDSYGLRSRIRFGSKVSGASFDEDQHLWRRAGRRTPDHGTPRGRRHRRVQPAEAAGHPRPRQLRGTVMHTARWDNDADLRGSAGGDRWHRGFRGAGDPVDRPRGRAAESSCSAPRSGACRSPTPPLLAGPAVCSAASPGRSRRPAPRARLMSRSLPLAAHYHGVLRLANAAERQGLKICASSATRRFATS